MLRQNHFSPLRSPWTPPEPQISGHRSPAILTPRCLSPFDRLYQCRDLRHTQHLIGGGGADEYWLCTAGQSSSLCLTDLLGSFSRLEGLGIFNFDGIEEIPESIRSSKTFLEIDAALQAEDDCNARREQLARSIIRKKVPERIVHAVIPSERIVHAEIFRMHRLCFASFKKMKYLTVRSYLHGSARPSSIVVYPFTVFFVLSNCAEADWIFHIADMYSVLRNAQQRLEGVYEIHGALLPRNCRIPFMVYQTKHDKTEVDLKSRMPNMGWNWMSSRSSFWEVLDWRPAIIFQCADSRIPYHLGHSDYYGPEESLSTAQVAAKLPTKNTKAGSMIDRMLRLLASYSLLRSSSRVLEGDGKVESDRIAPAVKFFVQSQENGSLASLLPLVCSRTTWEAESSLKDMILEGGDIFEKIHGMPLFQFMNKEPAFDKIFNAAMADWSTMTMKKILNTKVSKA
ncbi:Caffeic acid 3-O-methyltransferase-like protein [Drosera capensis]